MNRLLFSLFILSIHWLSSAQTPDSLLQNRIPSWAKSVLDGSTLMSGRRVSDTINPFYLESDFNGDKLNDIALLVIDNVSGKTGVIIINGGKNLAYLLGAGKDLGWTDDISKHQSWFVFRDRVAINMDAKQKKLTLKNDAIEIRRTPDSSIIIYWEKKKYSVYVSKN